MSEQKQAQQGERSKMKRIRQQVGLILFAFTAAILAIIMSLCGGCITLPFFEGSKDTKPEPAAIEDACTGCEWSHGGRKSMKIKPASANDGKLVIVLPGALCPCLIESVTVGPEKAYKDYKSYETTLPDGKLWGRNENATHSRFRKHGSAYGKTKLMVKMKSGKVYQREYDMNVEKSYDFPW